MSERHTYLTKCRYCDGIHLADAVWSPPMHPPRFGQSVDVGTLALGDPGEPPNIVAMLRVEKLSSIGHGRFIAIIDEVAYGVERRRWWEEEPSYGAALLACRSQFDRTIAALVAGKGDMIVLEKIDAEEGER